MKLEEFESLIPAKYQSVWTVEELKDFTLMSDEELENYEQIINEDETDDVDSYLSLRAFYTLKRKLLLSTVPKHTGGNADEFILSLKNLKFPPLTKGF